MVTKKRIGIRQTRRATKRFAWKSKLLKIPSSITQKIANLPSDDIIVACLLEVRESAITAGTYAHLGIKLEAGQLVVPESIVPNASIGNQSNINVNGIWIRRTDLPMTTQTQTIDSPNWGDWSKGSHSIDWAREVYQRDFLMPKYLPIDMELLRTTTKTGELVFSIRFCIGEVLNRNDKGFRDDLLSDLNLLQENVGAADVYPSKTSRNDYLKIVKVNWEILPLGEDKDAIITDVVSRFKSASALVKKRIEDRLNLLASLNPANLVVGEGGFERYIGAQFADDLVVFENPEYGNAIYIMFEDWQLLSQQTRIELLMNKNQGFIRIVHIVGWENEVKRIVAERRAP